MSGREAVILGVLVVAIATIMAATVRGPPGRILALQRATAALQQEIELEEVFDVYSEQVNNPSSDVWPFDAKDGACPLVSTRDSILVADIEKQHTGHVKQSLTCGRNMLASSDQAQKKTLPAETKVQNKKRRLLYLVYEYITVQKKGFVDHDKTIVNDVENTEEREIESRIVGGEQAVAGKWPWLVAIGLKSGGLSCGGTIINENWIVTAAHCFTDEVRPCSFNVRAGSFNWLRDTDGHHEDAEPEVIIKHPDFDPDILTNDIALVKLSRPLTLDAGGYTNAICLPGAEASATTGELAVAAGWGTTHEDAPSVPREVREVELPVLMDKQCNFDIGSGQLCAGDVDGGIDTCQGDSGGPLMVFRDNTWYLAGITSFGNGCGRALWPGIYTDVSQYTEYIASVLDRYS